ncbi:96ca82bc-67f3-4b3a-ab36-ffe7d8f40fbe [Podospora aff. communis PSN243]|uniref:96ca82bc-67f3-4b3a-ab36-ffe7d8f40fbe n=1 Tax=Podospora aff. communis PSN243 TaxID=3040156 RepID=A0AAV9GSR7_9PEZI|nr:96ca82bc-67f3-4b3a-ab36-ffe7d8f40fbe [Podospora aff. communis PSN243]
MAAFVAALISRGDLESTSAPSPSTEDLPHEDHGPTLNTVFWTLTSVSFLFMTLRLWCKYLRGRYLWWDDYVLIASWIALCVSAATTTVCVSLDYGKHLHDMRPEVSTKMQFVAVFAGFFSVLSAAWSKTSFALTVIRLSEPWMRKMIWFIIVTLNGILGTAMLFMWVKCRPFGKIWDDSIEGWCIDPAKVITLYQWSAGYSGSMDIVLALCPWVLLWRLGMTKREKAGVAICMSMGVVAGAASFVKMIMLPKLSGDPTETVAVTIWGGAEGSITIIAASIPVLRNLVIREKSAARAEPSPDPSDERRRRAQVSCTTEGSSISPSFGKVEFSSPAVDTVRTWDAKD